MDWLAFSKRGRAGRKSIEKGIRSIDSEIVEHEAKIAGTKDPELIRYWQREIEGLKKQRERQREKLGHA